MKDEIAARLDNARAFFAGHEYSEFYHAIAYSGYRHATDKQAEIMAAFAESELAAIAKERDTLREKVQQYEKLLSEPARMAFVWQDQRVIVKTPDGKVTSNRAFGNDKKEHATILEAFESLEQPWESLADLA